MDLARQIETSESRFHSSVKKIGTPLANINPNDIKYATMQQWSNVSSPRGGPTVNHSAFRARNKSMAHDQKDELPTASNLVETIASLNLQHKEHIKRQ